MIKPQSSKISNGCNIRQAYVLRRITLNHDKGKILTQFPDMQDKNTKSNWNISDSYINQNYVNCKDRYRYIIPTMNNLNYQTRDISLCKTDTATTMCQSQSFNVYPYTSFCSDLYHGKHRYLVMSHKSRLSECTYMSPPSPNWTTIGNVMAVKRSTSMPGTRPSSLSLSCHPSKRSDVIDYAVKKKYDPFQCLKHQFRKSGHKEVENDSKNRSRIEMPTMEHSPSTKITKALSKKKSVYLSNNEPNASFKSLGIRKSISLFFSKPNRSSKSDPNIDNENDQTKKLQRNIKSTRLIMSQHSSKRNHRYESMSYGEKVRLSNETNESCNYSGIEDSSSSLSYLSWTKPSVSVDGIFCGNRTESKTSLSDSVSVTSSDYQLSSLTASCHGNICYGTNDIGWKTVVGNVCRSNSKDSAIANSTLSGDGRRDGSKRISLTSTISKMSDLTTTSEDFNDSSYSSFNDLQSNSFHFSYSKPPLSSIVSHLQPIDVDYDTTETTDNSSDNSPSSDSSTETLRPSSCFHRRLIISCKDNMPSHSNTIFSRSQLLAPANDIKQKCLKRSYSWPGCRSHLLDAQRTLSPITKPPTTLQTQSAAPDSQNMHYPKLKINPIQRCNLNSSPLLSPYSRLYSLRSSNIIEQQQHRCCSGLTSESTQVSDTPIKYDNISGSTFLRENFRR